MEILFKQALIVSPVAQLAALIHSLVIWWVFRIDWNEGLDWNLGLHVSSVLRWGVLLLKFILKGVLNVWLELGLGTVLLYLFIVMKVP